MRFQIPQNVPFGASISLDHLATITGLDEDILARTVRYAITNGLFDEPTPGRIVHTAATAALAKNKGLHDMAVFNTGFSTRIIDRLADALITHQNKSDSSMTTAFNICHPGYADLFDYMGKNAEDSQAYFKFLDGRSQLPRYSAENIVNAWNWASIDRNTVIDVSILILLRSYVDQHPLTGTPLTSRSAVPLAIQVSNSLKHFHNFDWWYKT